MKTYDKILLIGHGGSHNHGAEAIVKCTVKILRAKYPSIPILLSTHFIEQDIEYGVEVDGFCQRDTSFIEREKAEKVPGKYTKEIYRSTILEMTSRTLVLSVGGDNYCYRNWERWQILAEVAKKRGAKVVLWSCSFDEGNFTKEMAKSLEVYDLITVRESVSHDMLLSEMKTNIIPCSDIAFLLEPELIDQSKYQAERYVVINISKLVVNRETNKNSVVDAVSEVIYHILDTTDYNVVLLPHVINKVDNDHEALTEIKIKFDNERVTLLPDTYNASQLKYIISQAVICIAARSHAAIAAYSSCVPTLAIGYSSKAVGIGKDLGCLDYVLPLENIDLLKEKTIDLLHNEDSVRKHLVGKIPIYSQMADTLKHL